MKFRLRNPKTGLLVSSSILKEAVLKQDGTLVTRNDTSETEIDGFKIEFQALPNYINLPTIYDGDYIYYIDEEYDVRCGVVDGGGMIEIHGEYFLLDQILSDIEIVFIDNKSKYNESNFEWQVKLLNNPIKAVREVVPEEYSDYDNLVEEIIVRGDGDKCCPFTFIRNIANEEKIVVLELSLYSTNEAGSVSTIVEIDNRGNINWGGLLWKSLS